MPDRNWKRYERTIAGLFGATRTPVLGDIDADIRADAYWLWIDCKLRREVPASYEVMLHHAEALGFEALAWKAERPLIIMRVSTVRLMTQRPASSLWVAQGPKGARPLEWVEHVALSAPDLYLPMIAMSRPGRLAGQSVAVFDADRFASWQMRWAMVREGILPAFGAGLPESLSKEASHATS